MKEKKRGFFRKKKDFTEEVETELNKIRERQKAQEIKEIIEKLMDAYKTNETDLSKYESAEALKKENCDNKYREIYENINEEQTEKVLEGLINSYCDNLIASTKLGVHDGFANQINLLQAQKALTEYKKFVKDDEILKQKYNEIEQKIKTENNFDVKFAEAKKMGDFQDEKFNSTNRAYLR